MYTGTAMAEAARCARMSPAISSSGANVRLAAQARRPVDGNKRLAWLATWVFLAKSGTVLDPDDGAVYQPVVDVAAGAIDDVDSIAAALASFSVRASD
jgi:hypothetical protein